MAVVDTNSLCNMSCGKGIMQEFHHQRALWNAYHMKMHKQYFAQILLFSQSIREMLCKCFPKFQLCFNGAKCPFRVTDNPTDNIDLERESCGEKS